MPKDNPFSDNPFGTAQDDPFSAHSAAAGAAKSAWGNGNANANAWGANGQGAYAGATAPPTNAFAEGGTGAAPSTLKGHLRQEQLELKEKELAAREVEIRRREEELRKAGALQPKKNWPICYPITHHDIAGDVPAPLQGMVRKAYFSYLAFFVVVTFNWFASLMALCVIDPNNGRLPGFLLANLYWFAGLPGAWILWYIRVYNAAIKDRAFTYAWFFLFYLVHIAFCTWAAVSPPLIYKKDWGHAGFITGIDAFNNSVFVGVLYMVGGGLWSLEVLWCIWVLKTVYFNFRGAGRGAQLKQEFAQEAVKAGMSRGNKPAKAGKNTGASDVPAV